MIFDMNIYKNDIYHTQFHGLSRNTRSGMAGHQARRGTPPNRLRHSTTPAVALHAGIREYRDKPATSFIDTGATDRSCRE